MYSASNVDIDISVYNLELQNIGTSPKVSNILVLLFTLIGSILCSEANIPAKSASAYKLTYKFSIMFGFIISPLSRISLRQIAICLLTILWICFRLWENAHTDALHMRYLKVDFRLGITSYPLLIDIPNSPYRDPHLGLFLLG